MNYEGKYCVIFTQVGYIEGVHIPPRKRYLRRIPIQGEDVCYAGGLYQVLSVRTNCYEQANGAIEEEWIVYVQ